MKTEHFTQMESDQLMEINGGGFAYDVGRVIRFIGMALPGDPISLSLAIADWEFNATQ
ncbi:MAG: hypothetical protein ABFS10_07950 [Bacteroidota bacterium]